MEKNIPRLLFAAPRSGSGKTLITCGFLEVLKRRGLNPVSFKCGPDYIDPMFHKYVLGVSGGNLDSFFLDADGVRKMLVRGAMGEVGHTSQHSAVQPADLAVIEGVMGYYDGLSGISEEASSYDIAKITKTPVVMVLDCKGASLSLVPVIKGFLNFRDDNGIKGVILNRLSPSLYKRLAPIIEAEGVTVFGYLPEDSHFQLKSRHLGLFMPGEVEQIKTTISELARQMEKTVNLDGLIGLAEEAEAPVTEPVESWGSEAGHGPSLRIGVARDEAFSFCYQENLQLMEAMGAELEFFSPLHDRELPEALDGLLLGGGYPELHAKELSENVSMIDSMKAAWGRKLPILAECGGFLYLHRSLEGSDGTEYAMVGAIDAAAFKTDKLLRFGYVTLTTPDGMRIKGHEFHYWESGDPGECWEGNKPVGGRMRRCMHEDAGRICGFPHLYYPSNPEFLRRWLNSCSEGGEHLWISH